MKIIFLDFDGVLNSGVWFHKLYKLGRQYRCCEAKLDPKAIKCLASILKETGCYVVITSSMRIIYGKKHLMRLMFRAGLPYKYKNRLIGLTPIHRDRFRGREIQEYLDNNQVSSFVIIDDDVADLQQYKNKLVKTKNMFGLRKWNVSEAVKILNSKG